MNLFNVHTLVGAVALEGKSLDKWYWAISGKRIDYPIPFGANEPNNVDNKEFCFSVAKYPDNNFWFNDIECNGIVERKFICERTYSLINEA